MRIPLKRYFEILISLKSVKFSIRSFPRGTESLRGVGS